MLLNNRVIDRQILLIDEEPKEPSWFTSFCQALCVDLSPGWADRFGESVYQCSIDAIHRPIRVLSLFTGAGGLDIGFHDVGCKIEAMVEIDSRFAATLQANTGKEQYLDEAAVFCGDIRDYSPLKSLKVDFIIGGPPCQTFSAAGRRAAGVMGTSDERGRLFEDYVRLLKLLKPKGFLFENVYGITGAENGKAWLRICDAFKDAGYTIFSRILDAADYGVPQHRERLFIVGTKGQDFKFPYPTHGPDSPGQLPFVTAGEVIHSSESICSEIKTGVGGRFGHLLNQIPPGLNYSFFTEKMGHPAPIFAWRSKFSDFLYKADPDTPIRTLKAQGGQYTGPFHWENRPFSIKELKQLQTFPNDYKIEGGRQVSIHQIGNSVPPQLARILALSISQQLFNVDFSYKIPLMDASKVLGFRKRKRLLTAIYRSKAEAAIKRISGGSAPKIIRNRTYTAALLNDFEWRQSGDGEATLRIEFVANKSQWSIRVSPDNRKPNKSFSIIIDPDPKSPWALPVSTVKLEGATLTNKVFTGAWKAFEEELRRSHVKADIVQLNGYYQYKPNLKCKMILNNHRAVQKKWSVLQAVVSGCGVGKTFSYHNIADLWDIPPAEVLKFAKWLRQLGYEVRNHRTNPQIPKNCLLVPYVFPTLSPMSVQLRKSLETE